MIRFVDLSQVYWTDPDNHGGPLCAFLSTSDDRFLTSESGQQTFHDLEEIKEHRLGERMAGLTPDGFFDEKLPRCVDMRGKWFSKGDTVAYLQREKLIVRMRTVENVPAELRVSRVADIKITGTGFAELGPDVTITMEDGHTLKGDTECTRWPIVKLQ